MTPEERAKRAIVVVCSAICMPPKAAECVCLQRLTDSIRQAEKAAHNAAIERCCHIIGKAAACEQLRALKLPEDRA